MTGTLLTPLAVAVGSFLVLTNASAPPRSAVRARPPSAPPDPRVAGSVETARRRRVPRGWFGWAASTIAITVLIGPLAGAIGVISMAGLGRARRITARRRRRRAIDRDLPETLDLFVLLLEAGVEPRSIIVEMSRRGPVPTRRAFAQVADRFEVGQPFAEALEALRHELGSGATALVDLLTASNRYGLPMAQVVSQLSAEARTARRRRDEARARALPVALSFPLVVCTLPSFVLLAIAPAVMAALSSLGSRGW